MRSGSLAASASAAVWKSGQRPSMHTAVTGAGGGDSGGGEGGGGLTALAWSGQSVLPVTAGSSMPSMSAGA